MHGDPELIKLNYIVFPDPNLGPHMRVDIAREAVAEIERLRAKVANLEEDARSAGEHIEELMSMFKCKTCYDQGWVVGVEGAWPGGGDPGNECQVGCPVCNPDQSKEGRA